MPFLPPNQQRQQSTEGNCADTIINDNIGCGQSSRRAPCCGDTCGPTLLAPVFTTRKSKSHTSGTRADRINQAPRRVVAGRLQCIGLRYRQLESRHAATIIVNTSTTRRPVGRLQNVGGRRATAATHPPIRQRRTTIRAALLIRRRDDAYPSTGRWAVPPPPPPQRFHAGAGRGGDGLPKLWLGTQI